METQTQNNLCTKLIPPLLSLIAGSVDVTSFLALNGLFVSHITGNLVILAVRIVDVGKAPIALILSVPVFIIMLAFTKLLAHTLEKYKFNSLRFLLSLQFLFLLGFLLLGLSLNSPINPGTITAIFAGMLGVSAMAVQNALVQVSLKGISATAVMTTNVTHFVIDTMDMWLKQNNNEIRAKNRANSTWPTILGFIFGCALGAVLEAKFGLKALFLPVVLAFIAVIISTKKIAIL